MRLLRLPMAMAVRFVVTRPRLKAKVRLTIARWPLLTKLVQRLTRQSSYQAPVRPRRQASGAMTPRSQRILRDLKKAQQARPD